MDHEERTVIYVRKLERMIGRTFGLLTVTREVEPHVRKDGSKKRKFEAICDCGQVTRVIGSNLKNGNTQSCGCLRDGGARYRRLR